ncbi:hypothetical protein NQZ68_035340 [Dissostichus eleginoides]|nr:hypothetical protein NQZ68_035340 [Dissostichus eleginoides]
MAQYSWISRFPSGLKMNDLVVWPSELPLFLFDIPETPCLCCSHGNLPWGNCVEGRCLVLVADIVAAAADTLWTSEITDHICNIHHFGISLLLVDNSLGNVLFLCHFVFLGNLLHLFVDSASESLALPEFELLEVSALPSLLLSLALRLLLT